MNAIDKYKEIQVKIRRFKGWSELIGKEYFGGTRGKGGQYGNVCRANGNLTIYHQVYDGSNNYHELDKEFSAEMEEAMKICSTELIKAIKQSLERQLEKARLEAAELVKEINLSA